MSGRITATLPLPREASGFSADMAEKSRVNEVAETIGTLALELELELEDGVLLLPHAVMARAALTAIDIKTAFFLT